MQPRLRIHKNQYISAHGHSYNNNHFASPPASHIQKRAEAYSKSAAQPLEEMHVGTIKALTTSKSRGLGIKTWEAYKVLLPPSLSLVL